MKCNGKRYRMNGQSGIVTAMVAVMVVLGLVMVAGCGGGSGSIAGTGVNARTGSIRIAVAVPDTGTGRAAGKVPADTASFSITVTGSDLSAPIEVLVTNVSSGEPVTIANIPIGLKTITVNALCSEGSVLATRKQLVTIEEGVFKDVKMTLGYTITSEGVTPTSLSFDGGEPLVIKNSTNSTTTVYISGSNHESITLGAEGQLKCYLAATGSYTINAGDYSAAATQETATNSTLKAGISADTTYGEAPLSVYLYADHLSADGATGDVTYQWDLDGGSVVEDLSRAAGAGTTSLLEPYAYAQFTTPGEYNVKLEVTQDGHTVEDTILIIVVEATDTEQNATSEAITISQIVPASIEEGEGGSLEITGTGFATGTVVTIGAATVTATIDSATLIMAQVPATLTEGTYSVTVTDADGQSATLSDALTISAYASNCPPSGTYYYAGMGGDADNTYSEFGEFQVSGSNITGTTEGNVSVGTYDDTSYSGTLTQNSDGTYEITDGTDTNKVIVNNDCSILGVTTFAAGEWQGGIMVRKGSAASYANAVTTGEWFLNGIYYEAADNYRGVNGGPVTMDSGSGSGTLYSRDYDTAAEEIYTGDLGISYSVATDTGIITMTTSDSISYRGALSRDGNTIIFASLSSSEQGIIMMTKQPTSFSYANDVQGQWRGIMLGRTSSSGMGGTEAWLINSSTSYVTISSNNSSDGLDYTSYDMSPSELESSFSAGDGSGRMSQDGARLFVGGGLMFRVNTGATDTSDISFYFKTDQSSPIGQPPTADAGADQSVNTNETVTLDGTASSDPDGDTLHYHWAQTGGPTVTLSDNSAAQPSFTPTEAGTYVFALSVRDDSFATYEPDTVTITVAQPAFSSSCPPTGDYWFIGTGGDNQESMYSSTGSSSFSGLTMTANYLTGSSKGSSDTATSNEQTTVTLGSNGVYTAGTYTIIPNNDCSFLAVANQETGIWEAAFMAAKGTSAEYAAMDDSGIWYMTKIYYNGTSGIGIEAGTIVTNSGVITGTVYYNNSGTTTEQSRSASATYTFSNTDGSIHIYTDDATYSGGVSGNGNIIIAATSSGTEQGIYILTRQPSSFDAASLAGQWRGVVVNKFDSYDGEVGESGVIEATWDADNVIRSYSVMDSQYGASTYQQTENTVDYETALAVNNNGSMLADWDTGTYWRDFFGEGHDFWIHAETFEQSRAYIEILFKTDKSAPVTQ